MQTLVNRIQGQRSAENRAGSGAPLENLVRNGKLQATVGDATLVSTRMTTVIGDIDNCPRGSQVYNQSRGGQVSNQLCRKYRASVSVFDMIKRRKHSNVHMKTSSKCFLCLQLYVRWVQALRVPSAAAATLDSTSHTKVKVNVCPVPTT